LIEGAQYAMDGHVVTGDVEVVRPLHLASASTLLGEPISQPRHEPPVGRRKPLPGRHDGRRHSDAAARIFPWQEVMQAHLQSRREAFELGETDSAHPALDASELILAHPGGLG
jgi:hypothetical protein